MTLADKALLTTGADYWSTHPIPALGLRSLRMADGPHGLRVQDDDNPDHLGLGRSLPATCFPPAVTLASSWDPALVEEVGRALAREARAQGVDVVLGPGIEVKRSPLCGRNFEYLSEDPLLIGRLAGAMVRGLQSQGVGACVKHFAVNTQETDRLRVSADVDERTLREIYLRAFENTVREGEPWTVMCSYNRINGTYASEHPWLLTTVLRDEWGFDGLVVSDWGAVHDPVAAVEAGLDLRMPGAPTDPAVAEALEAGRLDPAVLDRVLQRMERLAARTSSTQEPAPIDVVAHHELTHRAAGASTVLLHNDDQLLPLDISGLGSIAVIGELARSPRYQGAGSSAVNPTRVVSALDALRERVGSDVQLAFAPGYALDDDVAADGLLADAVATAQASDLVLLFLGLPPSYEAEGRDRTDIDLPAGQLTLVDALAAVAPRIVVALSNGSAVSTASWRDEVGAIVEFWLTGQAHGDTVVDVLLGDVNPSGKLAETVPLRLEDTPSYLDFPGEYGHVRHSEGIHVGYRWYDARGLDVDYPFGHGLSYTSFAYSDLDVLVCGVDDDIALVVECTVTNAGGRAGAEVVQVYIGDRTEALQVPVRELRGFSKVHLEAGASARVRVAIARRDLEHFHPVVGWTFTGGAVDVAVGASSRNLRLGREVRVPGTPLLLPLTVWSTLGEWLDHVSVGPALWALFEERGGLRGRIADLLGDPVGRDSIRMAPLAALVTFPGVPVDLADVEGLLP